MHEGKYIQDELHRRRVNLSTLAEKLGITRKTIYDHFKRAKADLNFIHALKEKGGITIQMVPVKEEKVKPMPEPVVDTSILLKLISTQEALIKIKDEELGKLRNDLFEAMKLLRSKGENQNGKSPKKHHE